jgi:CTP synthase (UTP-ammonia lyase)
MKLAIIGDFNPTSKTHLATNTAIEHAKKYLNIELDTDWISTDSIIPNLDRITETYQSFWIAPGSPYKSMTGALEIIKYARLNNIPVLGTCGGFQHMAIEFARNVLGVTDAEHAEYDPYASKLVVTPLSCSLAGQTLKIKLTDKQSLTYKVFNSDTIEEKYYCNFGLNPEYQAEIDKNGFKIVATDNSNEARILELREHKFFIATLFVPQDNSTFEHPHKLVLEFISVVAGKTFEVFKTSKV